MARHETVRNYYSEILRLYISIAAMFVFGCLWFFSVFILVPVVLGNSADLPVFVGELCLLIILSIMIYLMTDPWEPYWRFALGIILLFPIKIFRIWES